MITLTLQMPEEVAAVFYDAAEQINRDCGDPKPRVEAKALMAFALSRCETHDVCAQFDLALRVITGQGQEPLNPVLK
jgi:hypothetical protein